MENTTELIFIPTPGVGHLAPMVELARALTTRDHRISISLFIMNFPFHSKVNSYTQTLLSNQPVSRVRFIHLPLDEPASEHLRSMPRGQIMSELLKIHKPRVDEFLSKSTRPVAAFVLDMACIPFVDLAKGLGVPSYVLFTCGLGTLNLLFQLQSLHDDEDVDILEFKDSETELQVPGFMSPVPGKVLPYAVFEKNSAGSFNFLEITRKLREIKGILVNTFGDLEHQAVGCPSDDVWKPPIYAVGPVLNLNPETIDNVGEFEDIMIWLDTQPVASVVFLCFGSKGSFEAQQVVEIARALEHSGYRFLWSLRRPPPKGKLGLPTEYTDFKYVLPEGFSERTGRIGKVIGWAPQLAVLSHPALGGFVSHCGWNSILESLWCGVPVATWPLDSEQQLNAFEMVKELGLAVEISLDYREENPVILTAEEIERGIKALMEGSEGAEIRKKVKAMSDKSRKAVVEGGTSYVDVGHFIDDVLINSF